MNKRTIAVFGIILLILSPITAFDGFTDIFDEEPIDEATVAESSPLTIAGTVGFSIEAFRGEDEPFTGETEIGGGLDLDLSWKGSIVDVKTTLALHPSPDTSVEWIDIFTGLSLMTYFDGGYVEAGLLKREWGSGDGVHVVDVLNAPDYRKGIIDDTNAMKIAEPMVSTTKIWNDTSLEIVYKPMLIPMVSTDDPSNRWFMMSDAQYQTLKSQFGGTDPIFTHPTPEELSKLTNWQIGGRLKSIVGPADLGLVYYNGFLYQPSYVYNYNTTTSPPSLDSIQLEFTRAQLFGAEATMIAGPLTFMLEGGFWLSEDNEGTDPSKYNNKAVYLGGVGFMIPGLGAYTSITYHGHYILDFQEGNPMDADYAQALQSSDGKAYMNTITAALELPLARERVTVRLAGTYQLETGGYALLPSITWNVTDDFIFKATGRLFGAVGSSSESLFATWAKNDAIKLGISYVF